MDHMSIQEPGVGNPANPNDLPKQWECFYACYLHVDDRHDGDIQYNAYILRCFLSMYIYQYALLAYPHTRRLSLLLLLNLSTQLILSPSLFTTFPFQSLPLENKQSLSVGASSSIGKVMDLPGTSL